MNTTNRIIWNTGILYAKMVIVMVINLWTVPLLLRALGQSDYGLYQLVAGVIMMLTFINAAMTVSTQRYLSVAMGQEDADKRLNTIYNASLVMHVCIGVALVLLLELCVPFLFNGLLNIEPERIGAAKWIYQFLIVSTFFTIIAVPYDAVLNAYENMTVFAIISIIDAVLRLLVALALPLLSGDLLIIYGLAMAGIAILNVIIKYAYTHSCYKALYFSHGSFDKGTFKEMFGFAGWNTFNAFAIVGRNQGIAFILNLFWGTVINAAYGIANQINAMLVYFSATLQKSFNPQLMKSQGMNDNDRMLRYTMSLSKMSLLAISILALPLIIEMPYVLNLWLHNDVPENTVELTQYILVMSIIYLTSTGLMSAIQSTGEVRKYTIVIACILALNLPIAYLILWLGYPAYYVMYGMIAIEIICLAVRLGFAHHFCKLDIKEFITKIILPVYLIIGITFVCLWVVTCFMPASFIRLCLTCLLELAIFLPLTYYFVLSPTERQRLIQFVQPLFKRISK